MSIRTIVDRANEFAGRCAGWLASPFLLAIRLYVPWQFFKSGLVKLQDWDSTLYLFARNTTFRCCRRHWPQSREPPAKSCSRRCWLPDS